MTVNCSKAVMALSSFLCMLDAIGGRGGEGGGGNGGEHVYMVVIVSIDYEPSTMLCMPVIAGGGSNIAVAVACNKQGGMK